MRRHEFPFVLSSTTNLLFLIHLFTFPLFPYDRPFYLATFTFSFIGYLGNVCHSFRSLYLYSISLVGWSLLFAHHIFIISLLFLHLGLSFISYTVSLGGILNFSDVFLNWLFDWGGEGGGGVGKRIFRKLFFLIKLMNINLQSLTCIKKSSFS